MKNKTLRIGAGIVGVALAAGLVACSEEDTAAQGGRTIDNCGMEISIDEKPESIVTLRQATTENLFELGQKDKMVGTSSLRDKVQPKWQEAYDSIPVLSKTVATAEQVLDVDPDFIVATQRGSFVESLTGTREFWADNGGAPSSRTPTARRMVRPASRTSRRTTSSWARSLAQKTRLRS